MFKGFRIEIPVKTKTPEGVVDALAGYNLKLTSGKDSLEALTNTKGIAIFDNLQASTETVYQIEFNIPQFTDEAGITSPEFNLDSSATLTCQLDEL